MIAAQDLLAHGQGSLQRALGFLVTTQGRVGDAEVVQGRGQIGIVPGGEALSQIDSPLGDGQGLLVGCGGEEGDEFPVQSQPLFLGRRGIGLVSRASRDEEQDKQMDQRFQGLSPEVL
jgi:hypothetical protein